MPERHAAYRIPQTRILALWGGDREDYMRESGLIKISEMASLHGISRQTLILYDKNGLFKPVWVAENGYRYYSVDQVPRLRLICLLKEMGVPLTRIRTLVDDPTTEGMRALLADRRASIVAERDRLSRQLTQIEQMDEAFASITTKEKNVDLPRIVWKEERRVIFAPYPSGHMDPNRLHMVLLEPWNELLEAGTLPSHGFGSLLDAKAVLTDDPLVGAGSIVMLPCELELKDAHIVTLPAGEYVCMYKHSMPYEVEPLRRLLAWMGTRGLTPAGPVVDLCLLDAMFYGKGCQADFCRLEVLLP